MPQVYHSNAKTNSHTRGMMQKSDLSNASLANIYNVNIKTISKHKNREFTEDKTSRPNKIHYALSSLDKELIRVARTLPWMQLDDLTDTIADVISNAPRSNIYRTLKSFNIDAVPLEQKEKAKRFKEYEHGCLHIDVTYLPKFDNQKYYLFVAIDRATRLLYYKVYENKSSHNAVDFLRKCSEYFPFSISHILTDNGLEFTDK